MPGALAPAGQYEPSGHAEPAPRNSTRMRELPESAKYKYVFLCIRWKREVVSQQMLRFHETRKHVRKTYDGSILSAFWLVENEAALPKPSADPDSMLELEPATVETMPVASSMRRVGRSATKRNLPVRSSVIPEGLENEARVPEPSAIALAPEPAIVDTEPEAIAMQRIRLFLSS